MLDESDVQARKLCSLRGEIKGLEYALSTVGAEDRDLLLDNVSYCTSNA